MSYGFHYDDYHFIRPYPATEIRRVFHGPWDASGIETPYYRPLTICLYAARFAWFGLNAEAYHVLSLVMFALAATLFGVFAARSMDSPVAGLAAVGVFTVHPGMPYSAVAWITNQMHLAELLVVLAAVVWWFAVRRRSAAWWMPLLLFAAAAFMIKEDGVMLLPAIIALHLLRKYLVERDLPGVPWLFLGSGAIVLGGLLFLRSSALEGVPGRRLPSLDQAWFNFSRGLNGTFRLVPARRPYQPLASWFVTLLPLAALVAWRRLPSGARFGMAAGAALAVLFELPFIFIIKAEQLHLVTTGACLVLAAAGAGLISLAAPRRAVQGLAVAIFAGGLIALSAVARNIARDFTPFGPIVMHTDELVEGWGAVPVELREYLAAKREPGAATRVSANPADALRLVAFGTHGRELSPDRVTLRWMSAAATSILIARDARLVTIPLRHEIGAFREPARVTISADGRTAERLELNDGQWHIVTVSLKPRDVSAVRRMHALRIELDHAWVPAEVIPGSGDRRTLGLQIGEIAIR